MLHHKVVHGNSRAAVRAPGAPLRRLRRSVLAVAAADADVKVFYRTNWGSAKLHGSLQGSSWRDIELKKVRVGTVLLQPLLSCMHCSGCAHMTAKSPLSRSLQHPENGWAPAYHCRMEAARHHRCWSL